MIRRYTVRQLAERVGGSVRGDDGGVIDGVASLGDAGSNEASWVSNPKYAAKAADSRAGVVLVPGGFGPTPMPAILCDRVDRAVGRLLELFAPAPARPEPGVHPAAIVSESANVGTDTALGPFVVIEGEARVGARCIVHAGVFIGRGAVVGDDCELWPNVVIRDGCRLGSRVTIHPNAVVGADGFGFYFDEGRHHKVPHIGGVIVEDDVEIGACTCIDRAKFGDTVVGRGTKIDNLCQLAHNVTVGEHCVLAAFCGISGSVRIGRYSVFGGRAGAVDNVVIGERTRCAGGYTVVQKDTPDGVTLSGCPAQDHRLELRERAALRRLPALTEQLKSLATRVERLEASEDHSD